jgi:competence protein ComEC
VRTFWFVLILLSATPTNSGFRGRLWIVWNVGQGQWVTRVDSETCFHFDLGGEKFPLKKLSYFCGNKENRIYLSHWDLDHINGLPKARRLFSNICLALKPTGAHRREKLLKELPTCPLKVPTLEIWRGSTQQDSNSQSHVVAFDGFLMPGDSPKKQEELWAQQMNSLAAVKILVLGHHGSRTSTSENLLHHLKSLKMAVSSARWARYRHPHVEVQLLMRKKQAPLLRTEDWGHLYFEY